MTDANKEVDHDALNEVIHAWLGYVTLPSPVHSYTTEFEFLPRVQRRCDELDWRLEYQRAGNAPTRNGGEWYTVQVQLPKLGARIERAAHSLPLAICRAIEAAIEELKPEPEPRLAINGGSVRLPGEPYAIAYKLGADVNGIQIGHEDTGPIHIKHPSQIRDLAAWLNVTADDNQNDKSK